jgi:hypothetical protein
MEYSLPKKALILPNSGEQGRTIYWRKGCPVNRAELAEFSELNAQKATVRATARGDGIVPT